MLIPQTNLHFNYFDFENYTGNLTVLSINIYLVMFDVQHTDVIYFTFTQVTVCVSEFRTYNDLFLSYGMNE